MNQLSGIWEYFHASASEHVASAVLTGDFALYIGTAIFFLSYLCIAFEKKIGINKTVSALVGSSLMLFLIVRPKNLGGMDIGVYQFTVKFDVIFLLAGMMIIVHLLSETGLFQYIAIKCAKMGRGEPIRVLVLLVVVTACASAVLDNVTTVLFMCPMTLLVAQQLQINPLMFLIPMALSSNIGGTATMIGDPPNILVGAYARYAGISFISFIHILTPFITLLMGVFIGAIMLRFSGTMKVTAEQRARIMDLEERRAITNPKLMKKGLVVMGLTLIGFMLHGLLHIEPGVVAMGGAALFLLISRVDIEKAMEGVEWSTLMFFIGLFVIVGGAMEVGLFEKVATLIFSLTGDNPYIVVVTVLWVSGLCAGVINNFSFTAAAIPVVHKLALDIQLPDHMHQPLWWALALGACLGGNLTPTGAAANLVVIDMSQKSGHPITFGRFMRWGIPCAIGSLILSTGYVVFLMYLAHNSQA
ncbi:MAG: ArsB/NhaD family transporter [Planctomycetes bacterium]|nr:ArsB/NhaD family transporter [Planctomycetota bacterium]